MPDVVHVEFDWYNEFGFCDECGELPASYRATDLIFTIHLTDGSTEERRGQNLCPICAALWASYGERLKRLWTDPTDEIPKIRVYKRRPDDPNPEGFRADRPWVVAGIPEDSRKTCYPTWEDAMGWACLPSNVRAEIIEIGELMEGGW